MAYNTENLNPAVNGVYSRKKKHTDKPINHSIDGVASHSNPSSANTKGQFNMTGTAMGKKKGGGMMKGGLLETASFMRWGIDDVKWVLKYHRLPCVFAMALLFFMGIEYTLRMIPSSSPPFDWGFIATVWLNRFFASSPPLNTLCAALNTAFVGVQTSYILWAFLVEGRARPGIAALFMFTCRGILGYATQLPLPQDFLGSGADFPVGNVSFFLFYSGHVASAVIGSLDMRRMHREGMAWTFDVLNALQVLRLLGTRGHYTIDLAVGVGAGFLFDSFAGKYLDGKKIEAGGGGGGGSLVNGGGRAPVNAAIYSPLK